MYKHELECSNCDQLSIIVVDGDSTICYCPLCGDEILVDSEEE